MKKRYLILAGVLALTVAVAGCGKKQNTETQSVQASATPTPEITKAVVDMQQNIDDSNIKNVMGEKTSTASKVIFVNETGDDIQSVYIRTHVDESSSDYDDDEDGGWGDDLINGMFTLADKVKHCTILRQMSPETVQRVQLLMISVLHTQMKTRMNASSVTFLLERFHRSLFAWMVRMMMLFLMQNISQETAQMKFPH